jgi:hypothetical protein
MITASVEGATLRESAKVCFFSLQLGLDAHVATALASARSVYT